jgi:hypothetical protein
MTVGDVKVALCGVQLTANESAVYEGISVESKRNVLVNAVFDDILPQRACAERVRRAGNSKSKKRRKVQLWFVAHGIPFRGAILSQNGAGGVNRKKVLQTPKVQPMVEVADLVSKKDVFTGKMARPA